MRQRLLAAALVSATAAAAAPAGGIVYDAHPGVDCNRDDWRRDDCASKGDSACRSELEALCNTSDACIGFNYPHGYLKTACSQRTHNAGSTMYFKRSRDPIGPVTPSPGPGPTPTSFTPSPRPGPTQPPGPPPGPRTPEQIHLALGRKEGEMTVSWATVVDQVPSHPCTEDGGQVCPGWSPPSLCPSGCAAWDDLAGSGNTRDQSSVNRKFDAGSPPASTMCARPAHDASSGPWCYCAQVNASTYGYCSWGGGCPPPPPRAAALRWAEKGRPLSSRAAADTRPLNVAGCRSTHVGTLTGLVAGREYTYQVGDTEPFDFTYRRRRAAGEPERHIIFGDMGAGHAYSLCPPCTGAVACNCSGNTSAGVVSEIDDADMILHVGDFAYDLESGNGGAVGDQFMRNIEQVAARVPYMVSHGNHEDNERNLAHYIERFRGMPSNARPATFTTAAGAAANTLYYSWDAGLVHYVAISTELWAGARNNAALLDPAVNASTCLAWLDADLRAANANRAAVPWVVVHGHRAVYYDCKHGANGTCAGTSSAARGFGKDVEPLLFRYGADFWINGHEHNYERSFPMYEGRSAGSNVNARATVYITSGAAGCREMHEAFTGDQPTWSAFRSNTFGYSRMLVYNATHINWQQVQTDPTLFPLSKYGRVIDDVWYVQDRHGPFNESEAPRGTAFAAGDASAAREHDHWAPLLGVPRVRGRSSSAAVRAWRAAHGERAWARKEDGLLRWANARLGAPPRGASAAVWEDVREDGSSDGAWFRWRHGQQ